MAHRGEGENPAAYQYRPLDAFFSNITIQNTMTNRVLDNDKETVSRECNRLQREMSKISDQLAIVETLEKGDGNTFVFNPVSCEYLDKIKDYFTRNESSSRYEVSLAQHELPLARLKNNSMLFRQDTVTVHRHAFEQFKRPLPLLLLTYGMGGVVGLYLLYMIFRIVVRLALS